VYPSLPIITTIQSRTRLYTPGRPTAPRATIERQELVSLAFRAARPGDRVVARIPQGSVHAMPRAIVAIDSASGFPLANAEIHDPVSDSSARTDMGGRAILSFLADSGGLVTARRVGYAMREIHLPASSADTAAVRIVLSGAVSLPALVAKDTARRYISPALNGFEERRRAGVGGYFISDSTLRKEENRKLGDVMRAHVPGVMVAEGSHLANYLLKSPRCSSGGPLAATPISPDPRGQPPRPTTARDQAAAFPPFDLTQFSVSDLAGVEYYPDGTTLPAEFNHTSSRCGALLLWTRER
jgi:hypothetical protein